MWRSPQLSPTPISKPSELIFSIKTTINLSVMNLFSQSQRKPDLALIQKVKTWAYDLLEIDSEIGISVSQLQCKEPDCPPVETVITVLSHPAQQYKLHKALAEIEKEDLVPLFESK